MPYFIRCSIEGVKYLNDIIINNPVNLELCKFIVKGNFKYYPDNIGLPSIKFEGCDSVWIYDSKEQRDLEFEWISKIQK
jgi:hypothetical protein